MGRLVAAAIVLVWVACVPAPPTSPFPERLRGAMAADSAVQVIAAALRAERLPIDGESVAAAQRVVISTFTVRPGGLGESTIRLRFRVSGDGDQLTVAFEAEAQERRRVIEVGVEDPREPRRLAGPHVVNPNDREVIGKVESLLRRLAASGLHADSQPE